MTVHRHELHSAAAPERTANTAVWRGRLRRNWSYPTGPTDEMFERKEPGAPETSDLLLFRSFRSIRSIRFHLSSLELVQNLSMTLGEE